MTTEQMQCFDTVFPVFCEDDYLVAVFSDEDRANKAARQLTSVIVEYDFETQQTNNVQYFVGEPIVIDGFYDNTESVLNIVSSEQERTSQE